MENLVDHLNGISNPQDWVSREIQLTAQQTQLVEQAKQECQSAEVEKNRLINEANALLKLANTQVALAQTRKDLLLTTLANELGYPVHMAAVRPPINGLSSVIVMTPAANAGQPTNITPIGTNSAKA